MPDQHPDPSRPRIFCLGLNKTGTTSFHEAMEILGFRSLHWGGPPVRATVEKALAAGAPLLSGLDKSYDAFSDIEPLYRNFELLPDQYPGSWFVLTVRPRQDWIDSRRRHVVRNRARKAAGEYDGTFLDIDEDAWTKEWCDHLDRVRAHFAASDRFVEMDIAGGDGWDPLCSLLGLEPPAVPFPWANRDRV